MTWITEKELERNVKNKETNFVGRKTTILYITTVRKTGKVSSHQSGNERRRKKSEQEHRKRVTRKFLEVSRCKMAATEDYPVFYYIDTSVLLENIPLVKFIKTTSGTRVVYFP